MPKSIQAIMPSEEEKYLFEKSLLEFLKNILFKHKESEEFQKNLLKIFLQKCLPNNFINTKERADLAIYNGASIDSNVGVLFEIKSLSNKSEMMSKDRINTKAFQEILHYYINERIVNQNLEIKKLIITNGLEWFTVESKEIEKHFVKNKKFIDLYKKWVSIQLSSSSTDFLYKEVIAPFIDESIINGLKLAHFDFRDALKKGSAIEIKKSNLTQLYRFFTPENLLNKELFTDSNKLNKGFYDELLYLMGLEEVKVENKKVIKRLPESERQIGSFVENVIDRIQINDVPEELHQDTAVQLTVIWINRILFLKLLESQLVSFNNDLKYKFLTKELLPTFDDLYYLFFGVLAKKVNHRTPEMNKKFPNIPYLNSSLFEESEIELSGIGISIDRLREQPIDYYSKTVLSGRNEKRRTGKVDFLTYLFDFLDAFDFSTSLKQVNHDKSSLINASVLGLIFEKINGYKDGSFYTPGRITMYMSKNVIRKAVIQKINESKGWSCNTIHDVKFHINSLDIAKEINTLIDTIKVCDPAVGSGHFLVSVLNELIAIKSELRVLIDTEGRSLSDIRCTVVNDELIVQDFNGDNFQYKRNNLDSERIQKAIFHEKRKLIENCLFGVDINPNSVNICRLRLWIELLKHSYYRHDETNTQHLVTLPNIDINIKVGNSLLHKFAVKDNLDRRFTHLKEYVRLVSEYKETNNKNKKHEIKSKIAIIKENFSSNIETPIYQRVKRLRREVVKSGQVSLFSTKKEQKDQLLYIKEVQKKLRLAETELTRERSNPLFSKGLEWRIEFPEVLNDEGDFEGFDVIIANPPYVYSADGFFSKAEKKYFEKEYPLHTYQANTFGFFLELSLSILRKNGYCSMIIPNTFLTIEQYNDFRKYILQNTGDVFLLNSYDKIFEDAYIDNCIIEFKLSSANTVKLAEMKKNEVEIIQEVDASEVVSLDIINFSLFKETNAIHTPASILTKIDQNSTTLEPHCAVVKDGLKVYERGKGNPIQPTEKEEFELFKKNRTYFSNQRNDESYRKYLIGRNIDRYVTKWSNDYLKYGHNLAAPRDSNIFLGERILIRQIPKKSSYTLSSTFTAEPYVHERSLIAIKDFKVDPLFLLGVLNSKVESYYVLYKLEVLQRSLYPQLRLKQIRNFPVPIVSDDKQSKLASLVKQLLSLNSDPLNFDETEYKNLNLEVDELVMDFYNLDEDEKAIIRDFEIV